MRVCISTLPLIKSASLDILFLSNRLYTWNAKTSARTRNIQKSRRQTVCCRCEAYESRTTTESPCLKRPNSQGKEITICKTLFWLEEMGIPSHEEIARKNLRKLPEANPFSCSKKSLKIWSSGYISKHGTFPIMAPIGFRSSRPILGKGLLSSSYLDDFDTVRNCLLADVLSQQGFIVAHNICQNAGVTNGTR
jgi:hypothetical protein